MANPFVVHLKRHPYDVYVGRPTIWGNPFLLEKEEDRASVLEKYRTYLNSKPELIQKAKAELKGKILACWCAPRACHADVLAEIANS